MSKKKNKTTAGVTSCPGGCFILVERANYVRSVSFFKEIKSIISKDKGYTMNKNNNRQIT